MIRYALAKVYAYATRRAVRRMFIRMLPSRINPRDW